MRFLFDQGPPRAAAAHLRARGFEAERMNANCVKCNARCCRYFAVPLGAPGCAEDIDTARWYLLHEGTSIFIDRDGEWWLRVENRCQMLEEGRPASSGRRRAAEGPRCRDYKGRPLVCRHFSPKTCDYTLGRWDCAQLFRSAKELDKYVRGLRGTRKSR
jgi:uncharacterized protein